LPRCRTLFGLAALLLLAGCSGELSSLDPAGPAATATALLWWGMFGYFTLVLIVVVVLWFYAMRRDPGDLSHQDAQHIQNRWVFWGGLVLPGVSITAVLAFGLPAGHSMLPTPLEDGEAVQIHVTGHQWWFQVNYPDTTIELEDHMVIPAGVPIDVHLTSADVIHSFWVPRLGGKLDMVPGHTNVLRLEAYEPGTYRGICAEFCGRDHAHMRFTVEALEPGEFEIWLEEAESQ
jgi:cytochrome c oxidase subunit II